MNRRCWSFLKNKNVILGGLFTAASSEANLSEAENFRKNYGFSEEDKWERVKTIFRKDDFGNYHPELINSIQMAQYGAFLGGIIGGSLRHVKATEDYFRDTETELFLSKKEAHLKLVRHNTKSFVLGAAKVAPIFAAFVGGFTLFSSCLEAYRNKCGIIEYSIAGCGIGALFRIHFGIRGMFSGGVVGGALGTIYGTLQWGILKITGKDIFEVKYAHILYSRNKNENKMDIKEEKGGIVLSMNSVQDINENTFHETSNNKSS